jgi:Chromate transporter
LGLIAFGGPAAHVAILRDHLVVRRNWINEEQFMELFSIGQVRNTIVPVLGLLVIVVLFGRCSFVAMFTLRSHFFSL